MAAVRPFVTSPALTAIAIGYSNPDLALIADRVLPRTPVMAEKFKWTWYPTAQMFTVPPTRVGRTGIVNRVSFTGEERTASVEDYGLEDGIPISDIEEARRMRELNLGNFDPELVSAAGLTNLILLDREVRVASIVQNPSNYAASRRLALSGTAQFSDYVNSDPIGVLKSAFQSTLIYRPNKMSMSRDVWTVLSSHPALVNAIKGNVTGKGIITPEEFVRLFSGEGLKELNIGEGFVNTARRGQPEVLSRVWGKSIQLHYINTEARPEQGNPTWGFSGVYGGRIGGSWEDRNVGLQGGKVVRVGERITEIVVAPDTGFIIQNAVA
jgi:hypothetical protein